MNKLIYIYNLQQALFYIQNGLTPVKIGKAPKGDTYMAFDREETLPLFEKWCSNSR